MKTQLEQLKQELREFIELSKTITQGKWRVNHDMNWETFSVESEDTVCDFYCLCEETHLRHPFQEKLERNNATFIARSRNISPAMAECLLSQVEWLEQYAVPVESANQQLQQILIIWEAAK